MSLQFGHCTRLVKLSHGTSDSWLRRGQSHYHHAYAERLLRFEQLSAEEQRLLRDESETPFDYSPRIVLVVAFVVTGIIFFLIVWVSVLTLSGRPRSATLVIAGLILMTPISVSVLPFVVPLLLYLVVAIPSADVLIEPWEKDMVWNAISLSLSTLAALGLALVLRDDRVSKIKHAMGRHKN